MSKTDVNVNLNLRQKSNWYLIGGYALFTGYLAVSLFISWLFNILSAILAWVNWIILCFSILMIFYGWATKQGKLAIAGWVLFTVYLLCLLIYPIIINLFLISSAQQAIGG